MSGRQYSATNEHGNKHYYSSNVQNDRYEGTTKPLAINRQQARPMSPSPSSDSATARTIPVRPARSGLRENPISSRIMDPDSLNTIVHDSASQSRLREYTGKTDERTLPTSLKTAISAFKEAGAQRKKALINGALERDEERKRGEEEEKQRQLRIMEKVPGRQNNGRSKTLGAIDAVLESIEDDWAVVTDPDFVPVDLALLLLQRSSSSNDLNAFRQTKHMLSNTLKGSVDKHYQAFAAALPHHTSILNHLSATQSQITQARTSLQEAKDVLGTKRSDLVQLWTRGQTIEEMLRLLDDIEYLKSIPDALESLISEKRLLQAAGMLMRSLKLIKKPEMYDIGAISDLRSYLTGQETALRDILIDELHNHLFLKSFWCESRWVAYTPNQRNLLAVPYDKDVISTSDSSLLSSSTYPYRLKKFLDELAAKPNDPPLDWNDSDIRSYRSGSHILAATSFSNSCADHSRNPETDSFIYLEIVLESLAVLGKLGNALDAVSQRLPSEIYQLVEQTIDEVHERAEMSKRSTFYAQNISARSLSVYVFADELEPANIQSSYVDASRLRLAALEPSEKQSDYEILRDLFWTLYSKLDAVTQGLRVVFEVSNRIGSRREFKDSSGAKPGSLFPLSEMWLPIQNEVRILLNDYLSDEDKGTMAGRNPVSTINDILRDSKFNRECGNQIFRFVDTDSKLVNRTLRVHEDELNYVLRETVPGLAQGVFESAVQVMLSHLSTDDRLLSAIHHRSLVRSDAFHVSILFQPTAAFLERVSEILPTGFEAIRASTELLDEFFVSVYLPQLEEKSSVLFRSIVTSHDSFLIDFASLKLSSLPIIKAFTQLMALINSLCAILRAMPLHRESYSRLILSLIIQFYQRCSDRFHDVVSYNSKDITDARLLVAAYWAQREDLNDCLRNLRNEVSEDERMRFCKLETEIELGTLGVNAIAKEELLGTTNEIAFLGNLYHSIMWFIHQLRWLKMVVEETSPSNAVSSFQSFTFDPAAKHLKLPLSKDMDARFESLAKAYEQLAQIILFTLRIDLRCRAIHYLDSAMRHGNYRIDQDDSEPDPHIIDLNHDLEKADDALSSALPEKEGLYVFEGLESLMEKMLISGARLIRFANAHGIKKILRNIIALRQNVRITTCWNPSGDFDRAREYFTLYSLGPQALLDSTRKEKKFSFEEYSSILKLQCGVDQASGDLAASSAADRNYNMYDIELHGLELEHSKLEREM